MNKCAFMCLAIFSALWVSAAPLSQEDVDRLVETDILACLHQEDFEDAQSALRKRGATDAMLAHGYCAALDKAKDAPVGSSDAERFQGALHGFAAVASECQLTNLLRIASAATNQHSVADAVLAYHRRDPLSRELMDWCVAAAFADDGREWVKSTAWKCIRKTIQNDKTPPVLKVRLLEAARRGQMGESGLIGDREACKKVCEEAGGAASCRAE